MTLLTTKIGTVPTTPPPATGVLETVHGVVGGVETTPKSKRPRRWQPPSATSPWKNFEFEKCWRRRPVGSYGRRGVRLFAA